MSNKSVLITGCSGGGIGHALAIAFQKRGFTVFATARSTKKMEGLTSLSNVHLLALDVTNPSSVDAVVKEVSVRTGGKLDVLVNNAGQQFIMPALDIDIDAAKELFEVNYWAPLRMVQAYTNLLIAAKGCVVNIASIAACLHLPFQSQYNASKAAIASLSETLRFELAPLGVRVVTSMAGLVESNIMANNPPPVSLPPHSQYLPIEKHLAEDLTLDGGLPTAEFAEYLVDNVLKGSSGKVWKGGSSGTVRWAAPFMPQWYYDKLMISLGRGLKMMP